MKNIYQAAREAAGITQERSAEMIGLSVESVRAYECEKRIPSDETVLKMIDVYGGNYLAYQHLKYKTAVGNAVLPDISEMPLSNASLSLLHELHDCLKEQEAIVEISMDGKVSDEEQEDWNRIMQKCCKLCTAIFAVQFSKK